MLEYLFTPFFTCTRRKRIRDDIIVYVNTSAPLISPLFRSDAQGEILARLFLATGTHRHTTAELAKLTHSSYATAHREVQRLIDAGLLEEEFTGRSKFVTPNQNNPAYPHL